MDDALTRLQQRPAVTLAVLELGRYILERLLEQAKAAAWAAERSKACQTLLFSDAAAPVTTSECAFKFSQEYPAKWFCERTTFTKHYYDKAGELDESGEEYRCAVEIDKWNHTDVWVRNLSRRERTSFWLQTASDRFYPDFLVKLKDTSKILAVEYKGKQLETNEDSAEKERLGQLWADRSSETALFVMVTEKPGGKSIKQQLEDALAGGKSIFARQSPRSF